MPCKRKKTSNGPSSSAPPSYDAGRFVNEEAFKRYRVSVARRALIPERGFLVFRTKYVDIQQEIRDRKWGHLVKQPDAAVVPVVREFYANAPDAVGDDVFVRGKKVSFSRMAINRLYRLSNINDEDFRALVKGEQTDPDAILQTVCSPGATWKMNGTQIVSLKQSSLSRTGKAWLSFVSSKLLPVMHQTDVTVERVRLVYAIITGLPIDVGSLIHNHILESLKGMTTGGLGHTSLITQLCKDAGVCWGPDEELLQPQRIIDDNVISGFKSSSSDCATQAPPAASSTVARRHLTIAERLEELEAHVNRTLQQHHDELRTFMHFQTQAVIQLLSHASLTPLVAPPVFPSAPVQSVDPSTPNGCNDDDDDYDDADDDDQ